jgi:hypothetical protein
MVVRAVCISELFGSHHDPFLKSSEKEKRRRREGEDREKIGRR